MFGNASASFIGYVAFGPVFGPHVAFAGGVAAVAYASRRGYANGKDIVTPLITLGKTDVLLAGAGFGVLGYLLHAGISAIPWFGGHTDAVAVTVIVSGLIARFAFGQSGLTGVLQGSRRSSARTIGALQPVSGQSRYAPTEPSQAERLEDVPPRATGWSRFAPSETGNWVRHQESFAAHSTLGLVLAHRVAAGRVPGTPSPGRHRLMINVRERLALLCDLTCSRKLIIAVMQHRGRSSDRFDRPPNTSPRSPAPPATRQKPYSGKPSLSR